MGEGEAHGPKLLAWTTTWGPESTAPSRARHLPLDDVRGSRQASCSLVDLLDVGFGPALSVGKGQQRARELRPPLHRRRLLLHSASRDDTQRHPHISMGFVDPEAAERIIQHRPRADLAAGRELDRGMAGCGDREVAEEAVLNVGCEELFRDGDLLWRRGTSWCRGWRCRRSQARRRRESG